MLGMFGQSFDGKDLATIGVLIILEGVLSIDNALVLGLLARRVPKDQQARALTYGLIGAFVFRFISIATAQFLLKWRVVKLLGGGYLVYIALKHFFFESKEEDEEVVRVDADGEPMLVHEKTGVPLAPEEAADEIKARVPVPVDIQDPPKGKPINMMGFWHTVAVIELTDIAFAVDSILAAIALVGPTPKDVEVHPKLWVVVTGGMLGVMLMRVAAALFIRLLEKFPRFEAAAYLLVIVIGGKLLADWGLNSEEHPHAVDFHDHHSAAFWVFWISMLICFCIGFIPHKTNNTAKAEQK